MAKVKPEVNKEAKVAAAVKPKDVIQIDGHTAKVIAIFMDIDFKSSNGGHGHKKGYIVADKKKRAVFIGETTLKRSFPNAMDDQKPQKFSFAKRADLLKLVAGLEVLNPCEIIDAGTAKTRPNYSKPRL